MPNQAYPLDCLGNFHLIVGDYDLAITNLQQSLETNPDYHLSYKLLGETYLGKGMYSQALASYERYLDLAIDDAQKAEAHFYLGKFYYINSDHLKAIHECQKALELDSEIIEAHWIQGLIFVRRKIFDQAESEVLTINDLMEKKNVEELKRYYYHLFGELSFSKGHHKQAIDYFNKAANIESVDRQFFINASGEAYFKVGELDKAAKKLESVIRINPNHAQSHYLLGLVYQKRGEQEKAREHFEKFMDIWEDADENLPQLVEVKKQLEVL